MSPPPPFSNAKLRSVYDKADFFSPPRYMLLIKQKGIQPITCGGLDSISVACKNYWFCDQKQYSIVCCICPFVAKLGNKIKKNLQRRGRQTVNPNPTPTLPLSDQYVIVDELYVKKKKKMFPLVLINITEGGATCILGNVWSIVFMNLLVAHDTPT